MQTQLQKQRKDPAETRCKIALLILFLLGAALIAGGLWGSREYQNSGFDQENAYHYIHELSGKVDSLYEKSIQPLTAKLTQAEQDTLTARTIELLKDNWSSAAKADQSARVDAMLAGLSGDKLQRKALELLSITYSLNGPKVSSAERSRWRPGATLSVTPTVRRCCMPRWMKRPICPKWRPRPPKRRAWNARLR